MGRNMDELDRRRRRRLDEYAVEFNRRVETMNVVDALGALLPDSARQKLQCIYDREGRIYANRELSSRVRSRDEWFKKLIEALRDCDGCDSLVDNLVFDDEGSLMPEFKNDQSGSSGVVDQSKWGMTKTTKSSFPNMQLAEEEQATKLTKYERPTSMQTRPDSFKKRKSTTNYQEKGTLECTKLQNDRKEEKRKIQKDDKIMSDQWKEELSQDQAHDKATDSKNRKDCKEAITSLIDEKEKEEADDILLDPRDIADDNEPQQIDKNKNENVINGPITQNVNADLIDVGQQRGATSPLHGMHSNAQFVGKDSRDPKSAEDGMNKRFDAHGTKQNSDVSYSTGRQQVHKRSTICVSEGRNCQKGIDKDRVDENPCKVDPVLNGAGRRIIATNNQCGESGDIAKDDDTEFRFFRDMVMDHKCFSKASEPEKEILKDLGILDAAGERNPEKFKELGEIGERRNSGNSYQPLKSNDTIPSHSCPSFRKYPQLQLSATSEDEHFCTYPPKSRSGEKVSSPAQNNTGSTMKNETEFEKGTEAMEDSHPVARNSKDEESMRFGCHQLKPIKEVNDKVVNGVNVIAAIPAVCEEYAEDDLGCQDRRSSKLTNAGGRKGGRNETESVKEDAEARPVLEELCNMEPEISTENPRHSESKEIGPTEMDTRNVEQKDVESVNDKKTFSNDVTSYIREHSTHREAGGIIRNPKELQDVPISEQGTEIQRGSDDDVNNTKDNLDRELEEKDEEEPTMQLNDGFFWKAMSVFGSVVAAMMYHRSHS